MAVPPSYSSSHTRQTRGFEAMRLTQVFRVALSDEEQLSRDHHGNKVPADAVVDSEQHKPWIDSKSRMPTKKNARCPQRRTGSSLTSPRPTAQRIVSRSLD